MRMRSFGFAKMLRAGACAAALLVVSAAGAATTKTWTKLCTDVTYQALGSAGITQYDKNQSFFIFSADMLANSLSGTSLFKYGSSNSNYVEVRTTSEGKIQLAVWRNGKSPDLTAEMSDAVTAGRHIFALKIRRGTSDANQLLCAILYMDGALAAQIVHGQDGRDESLVYSGNPMANYQVGQSGSCNLITVYRANLEGSSSLAAKASAYATDLTDMATLVADAAQLSFPSEPVTVSATVTSNTNWGDINWNKSVTDWSRAILNLTVRNDARITINETVSCLMLNVSGSVTWVYPVTLPSATDLLAAVPGAPIWLDTQTFADRVMAADSATTFTYAASVDAPDGYVLDASAVGCAIKASDDLRVHSLNVNFAGGRNTSTGLNDASRLATGTAATTRHGAYGVLGSAWNDVAAKTGTEADLAYVDAYDQTIAPDTAPHLVLSKVANDYTTARTENDQLLFGYCDDGNDGPTVALTHIPFSSYRIIAYMSTDSQNSKLGYLNVTVDGETTSYCGSAAGGSAGKTIQGASAWGSASSDGTSRALGESVNYLVTDVMTASEVTLEVKKGDGRAGLAGFQIVDCSGVGRAMNPQRQTISADASFGSIVWNDGNTISGSATGEAVLTVSGTASDAPVTITFDDPSVVLAKLSIVSARPVILAGASEPTGIATLDLSGVTGDLKRAYLPDSDVISVNFVGNAMSGDVWDHALAGNVPASAWTLASGASGSGAAWTIAKWRQGKIAIDTMAAPDMTVNWAANTTYSTSGSPAFMQKYLDDGTHSGIGGVTIAVTNIPFATYGVIIYTSSDMTSTVRPFTVNGTVYSYDSSGNLVNTEANWGAGYSGAKPVIGQNAMKVSGLSGNLLIQGRARSGSVRCCVAGIQIVNEGAVIPDYEATVTEGGTFDLADLSWTPATFSPTTLSKVTVTVADGVTTPVTLGTEGLVARLFALSSSVGSTVTLSASASPSCELDLSAALGKTIYGWPVEALVSTTANIVYGGGAGSEDAPVNVTLETEGGTLALTGSAPYYLGGDTFSGTQTTIDIDGATVYATHDSGGFGVGQCDCSLHGGAQLTASHLILSQGYLGRTATMTVSDTSRVTITGSTNGDNNKSTIMFGHWDGPSTFTLSDSATFTASSADVLVGKTGNSQTINLNGGTFAVRGIKASGNASGTNVLNLRGAKLVLGETGITSYSDSTEIQINVLANTTIEAAAATVPVSQPMTLASGKTLTLAGSGTVVFRNGYRGAVSFSDTSARVGYVVTTADFGTFTLPDGVAADRVDLYDKAGTKLETASDGSGRLTYAWDAAQYKGANAWWDFNFDGNLDNAGYDTVIRSLYADWQQGTDADYTEADATGNRALRVGRATPYAAPTFPSEMTVVMYGKLVSSNNTVQIGFGSSRDGSAESVFLATGDTSKKEVKLCYVHSLYESAVELCSMTAANAQSADHLYAFIIKQTGTQTIVDTYLDGVLLQSYTHPTTIQIASGFQVGSIHGGIGYSGYNKATSGEENATLDFVRIYDEELTSEVLQRMAVDYPYEPPTGTSSRTVTANGSWVEANAWTLTSKTAEKTISTPLEEAPVVITMSSAATLALNMTAAVTYEKLTVEGAKLTLGTPSVSHAITITGPAVINGDLTAPYDALVFQSGVTLAAGKKILFDCTRLDAATVFEDTTFPLIGSASLGSGATVTVGGLTQSAGRTVSFVYDKTLGSYAIQVGIKGALATDYAPGLDLSSVTWYMGSDDVTKITDWSLAEAIGRLDVVNDETLDIDGLTARKYDFALNGNALTLEGGRTVVFGTTKVSGYGSFDILDGRLEIASGNTATLESDVYLEGAIDVKDGATLAAGYVYGNGGVITNNGTLRVEGILDTVALAGTGDFGTLRISEEAVLNVGTLRGLTVEGAGTVDVVLTDAELVAGNSVAVLTTSDAKFGRVYAANGRDITASMTRNADGTIVVTTVPKTATVKLTTAQARNLPATNLLYLRDILAGEDADHLFENEPTISITTLAMTADEIVLTVRVYDGDAALEIDAAALATVLQVSADAANWKAVSADDIVASFDATTRTATFRVSRMSAAAGFFRLNVE